LFPWFAPAEPALLIERYVAGSEAGVKTNDNYAGSDSVMVQPGPAG